MPFKSINILLLLFVWISTAHATQTPIHLTPRQAQHIGQRIWHNEGAGKVENLTVWNEGEEFPSFGIGHFIWYPADIEGPFNESFPQLLQYLKHQGITLPKWLENTSDAPWHSRDEFYANINGAEMNSLRQLLQNTDTQQVEFIGAICSPMF